MAVVVDRRLDDDDLAMKRSRSPSGSTPPGPKAPRESTNASPAGASSSPFVHWLAGSIERVHLRNFMCHQDFVYSPNNCLNFLRLKLISCFK